MTSQATQLLPSSPGTIAPTDILIDELGLKIEAAFAKAAKAAVQEAVAKNIPVAVMDSDGTVAWLHPDGITRKQADPVSPSMAIPDKGA